MRKCEGSNVVALCDVDWRVGARAFKAWPQAKKYQDFNGLMKETFATYAEEVKTGVFPGEEHSYKMSDEVLDAIETEFKDSTEEDIVGALDYVKGFFRNENFSGIMKFGGNDASQAPQRRRIRANSRLRIDGLRPSSNQTHCWHLACPAKHRLRRV